MRVIKKKIKAVSLCMFMLSLVTAHVQAQEELQKEREVKISRSIDNTVKIKLKVCKCYGFKVPVGNRLAFVFVNPDIGMYPLDTGPVFIEKEVLEALNNIVQEKYTPTTKQEVDEIISALQK